MPTPDPQDPSQLHLVRLISHFWYQMTPILGCSRFQGDPLEILSLGQ